MVESEDTSYDPTAITCTIVLFNMGEGTRVVLIFYDLERHASAEVTADRATPPELYFESSP